MSATLDDAVRCPAAHPEDRSSCQGPADAVLIVDAVGDEAIGCVHHGAALVASVAGTRVYPLAVPGAAIDCYRRAVGLPSFPFYRRAVGVAR